MNWSLMEIDENTAAQRGILNKGEKKPCTTAGTVVKFTALRHRPLNRFNRKIVE